MRNIFQRKTKTPAPNSNGGSSQQTPKNKKTPHPPASQPMRTANDASLGGGAGAGAGATEGGGKAGPSGGGGLGAGLAGSGALGAGGVPGGLAAGVGAGIGPGGAAAVGGSARHAKALESLDPVPLVDEAAAAGGRGGGAGRPGGAPPRGRVRSQGGGGGGGPGGLAGPPGAGGGPPAPLPPAGGAAAGAAAAAAAAQASAAARLRHLKDLPPLKHAALQKRDGLFQQKLALCSVVFSFEDPDAERAEKEVKRQTLLELVDYVTTPAGQKIFAGEAALPEVVAMVRANLLRPLPPAAADLLGGAGGGGGGDPEDEEPAYEPAWPHLQVVYEFFLRFVVSSEVSAKAAKKHINQRFVHQFIALFDSEDPRERDYLKTILHRIYGKFMSLRSYVRREVSNVFFRFVYETERHNGIGELLEILGSIINGFAIPLKHEHLTFLQRALNPLHKPAGVAVYHQQLSYCLIQYVQKDPDTGVLVLQALVRFWPWSCSAKQLLFMNELEDILEMIGDQQLLQGTGRRQVRQSLFRLLARCLSSDHFQVAERTLLMWNNEHLLSQGCFSQQHSPALLPLLVGPLRRLAAHWNQNVRALAETTQKLYMEYDPQLFEQHAREHAQREAADRRRQRAKEEAWAQMGERAAERALAARAGAS